MRAKNLTRCLALASLVAAVCLLPQDARAQFGRDKLAKVATAAEAQKDWTLEEEKAIGEATAAKLVAVFGLYENPAMVKYVNLVGQSVAQYAGRQDITYRFAILDHEMVNAFACPAGYIFVTRGLLANVNDEAELAGVLAHEVIHAADKHVENELRGRKTAGLAMQMGSEEAVSATGGVAGMALEQALKVAEKVTDQLLTGKLSRDKESDADTKGLALVAAVGYDPRAFPEFLDWLGQASTTTENSRFLGNLTASHPKYADRVKRLNELIAQRGWGQQEWVRLDERYLASTDFTAPPAEPVIAAAETPAAEAQAPAGASTEAAAAAPSGAEPATPAATGGFENFSLKPFSADMISTYEGKKHRMKVYSRERAFRMEVSEGGAGSISIMRYDRRLMWAVIPDQKMYMEMPMQPGRSLNEAAYDPEAKVEREVLGTEKVGPYTCVKARVKVTSQGNTYSGLQWAAQELEGFVVKMVDEKSGATVEYENVKLGAPDAALFEPPAGYTKMQMPGSR
ncbi:MAG: M48 family metalloprotease [Candidatus Acidiferrales bacterium]